MEALEVAYCGGAAIEKETNRLLMRDNNGNKHMLEKIQRLPKCFTLDVIEAIKSRALFTMQLK